ncbi:MAG: hypothetical protein IPK53_19720 [bacterium]|nr:hypothetical protein [bacterium]
MVSRAIPRLPEQRAIASFLDRETGRIDELIGKKERQIELLQEKRQALISHAVTKGLDPKAKLKDSGIEWLGMVPEGWGQVASSLRLERFPRALHHLQKDWGFQIAASDSSKRKTSQSKKSAQTLSST